MSYPDPPPPSSSDPYGQSSSGQSPYGQSPYGQPPTGQYPSGGQPPYGGGQPPFGGGGGGQPPYGEQPKVSGRAVAAMVTGLVGLLTLCCGFFVVSSVAAVVLGLMARKEIEASGGRLRGSGQATTGLVTGAIGIALFVLSLVLVLSGVVDYNFDYSTS